MKSCALLALLAALCALSDALAAPAAPLGVPSAPLAVSGVRALRQEAREAENEAQDAAEEPDGALREPRQPALHRVYDPVTGLTCDLVSECLPCPVSERDETFCRETGHRQELSCPRPQEGGERDAAADKETKETRFRACVPPLRVAPAVAVFKFEVIMSASLAAAFYLLMKERRNHMSSFDLRKEPRQTRTLLGSTTKDSD